MHTPIFTMYVGTTKLMAMTLKTENFDNIFFYSFEQAKCWHVRLTIKTTPKSLL